MTFLQYIFFLAPVFLVLFIYYILKYKKEDITLDSLLGLVILSMIPIVREGLVFAMLPASKIVVFKAKK